MCGGLYHAGLPQNQGPGKGQCTRQEAIGEELNRLGWDRAREPRGWMGTLKWTRIPGEFCVFTGVQPRIAGGICKTPGVYAGKANRNTTVRFVRLGSLSRRFAIWGEEKWSQKGPYPWGIRGVANFEEKVNRRGRRWVFSGGRKARGRGMAGT